MTYTSARTISTYCYYFVKNILLISKNSLLLTPKLEISKDN